MSRPVLKTFCSLALLLTSCAQAQPAGGRKPDANFPAGNPAQPAKVSPDASVDQVLDALDARGKSLKGFTANVSLTEEDEIGLSSTRTGKVWYQQPAAGENARIRVSFDKRESEKKVFDEKIDYVLEGAWLIDRDYQRKLEIKRQVLRPGEKINLLKLGEGPFPLPIGQDKADVHKLFDVTKQPVGEDKGLANTVHLKLVPKAGTEFAKKFSEIEVWVDPATEFPKRIDTADAAKTKFRTTRLDDVKVNPPDLGDKDFTLAPVDDKDWQRRAEPFSDSSSGRE